MVGARHCRARSRRPWVATRATPTEYWRPDGQPPRTVWRPARTGDLAVIFCARSRKEVSQTLRPAIARSEGRRGASSCTEDNGAIRANLETGAIGVCLKVTLLSQVVSRSIHRSSPWLSRRTLCIALVLRRSLALQLFLLPAQLFFCLVQPLFQLFQAF